MSIERLDSYQLKVCKNNELVKRYVILVGDNWINVDDCSIKLFDVFAKLLVNIQVN